jgi:hypothetical protein
MRYLILIVLLAGCGAPGMERASDAWEQHDLQLARLGKAKSMECRAVCADMDCFDACVGDVAELLDTWCQIQGDEDSPACQVLDDLVDL